MLKADTMLARFQEAGGKVQWLKLGDAECEATFSHPAGGSVTIHWDLARAKQAGLGGKEMWSKYPRQMLRSRVVSEGIRTVFPMVLCGMYTPEEIKDMEPIDVTPVRTSDVPTPAPRAPPKKASKAKQELRQLIKENYEGAAAQKAAFHSLTGYEKMDEISDAGAEQAIAKLKKVLEGMADIPTDEPPFDVEDSNG